MTTKEAATKVCPFMSQVNHVVTWNDNGYNHDIKLNNATFDAQNCIGDKCMAWRWSSVNNTSPNHSQGYCVKLGNK